ncbi:MAG: aldehyde dehydrogenase family protein, partial [Myxococcota bacterium]
MWIAGAPVHGKQTFDVTNPATGDVIGSAYQASPAHVADAVRAAREAQPGWAALGHEKRCELLGAAAALFESRSRTLAELITREQGKPLSGPGSMFEMQAVVGWTQVPASLPMEPEVVFEDDTRRDEVHYGPLGVVAAIAPWNWPVMIAIWQIVPALRMGNTVVIKPSENTPLGTLELVRLFNTLLPAGVLNVVTGDGKVGQALVESPDVDKIMFTGSVATGQRVATAAAANGTRVTLELGGNDAAIVLPDADPEQIAEGLFWGCFINMGQTCACAKRLYVPESKHDAIVGALAELAEAMPMGNGLDESNVLGPVQNQQQYDKVAALVDDAKRRGATIVRGGAKQAGPGFFYPVTIVTDVEDGVPLVDEEQFGPAIPVIRYQDVDDAVRRANASPFGLGASVWSSDSAAASAVAQRIDAGTVWVNQHGAIHPMVPFGGAKGSGSGLEFGVEGLKAVAQ